MSDAWKHFKDEFLHCNSWELAKDGFPGDLLDALSDDERERAAGILSRQLDGRNEWAIRAMARLNVPDSVPRLRELLENCTAPTIRTAIAEAIYQLTNDSSMENIVTRIATKKDLDSSHRVDAINSLGRFRTDTALKTLSDLAKDPNYEVAYNARTLFECLELLKNDDKPPEA
jgi:HEAT repeat protein